MADQFFLGTMSIDNKITQFGALPCNKLAEYQN
jgi:hypothetical protein